MKILKLDPEGDKLNLAVVSHRHTNGILNDAYFYNNSESSGLVFTYRNGSIEDLIQIDYSRNIQEQE